MWRNEEFKRRDEGAFPAPQFCLELVLDPILRQSNLTLDLYSSLCTRTQRKKGLLCSIAVSTSSACVHLWDGWVAGAERGSCSCEGKYHSGPRPGGPPGRLFFQVQVDH